jgi:hypothetical protein
MFSEPNRTDTDIDTVIDTVIDTITDTVIDTVIDTDIYIVIDTVLENVQLYCNRYFVPNLHWNWYYVFSFLIDFKLMCTRSELRIQSLYNILIVNTWNR